MQAETTESYTVSAKLLVREDFRAACDDRDFARMFQLMKQWDGASQDKIAAPVPGLTQSRVSRIMRGNDRIAGLELMERIADALRIPGAYLGLAPRAWEGVDVADLSVTNHSGAPLRIVRDDPAEAAWKASAVSGPTLVQRPVGLRPHVERAFAAERVSIDFAGLSGETLAGAMAEPLDQVRAGRLTPSSLAVRILVPDTAVPWALPCRVEDRTDNPAFRERAARIAGRSLGSITDAIDELAALELIPEARCEIRTHPVPPTFKLYVLNDRDVFFGFYPVTAHTVTLNGQPQEMYDLMGKDAMLFHHDGSDPESLNGQYVAQARTWFESIWTTVAYPYQRP